MAFEEKINEFLYAYLQKREVEKFNKKLAKITAYGIAYGVPNHSYFTFNYSMEKFQVEMRG